MVTRNRNSLLETMTRKHPSHGMKRRRKPQPNPRRTP